MRNAHEGFLILSTQRSGSIWLMSLLDSHPHILCAGELFKPNKPHEINHARFSYRPWADAAGRPGEGRARGYREFFDHCLELAGDRLFGFKLMCDQLEAHPGLAEHLGASTFSIIRLQRRNHLGKYVSAVIAKASDTYVAGADGPGFDGTIEIDTADMLDAFATAEREEAMIDSLFALNRSITVDYESLQANPTQVLGALQGFLGVPELELRSPLRKIVAKPMVETISNYDEVEQALADTRYARFLRE